MSIESLTFSSLDKSNEIRRPSDVVPLDYEIHERLNHIQYEHSIPIYTEKTDINKKIHKFDDYIIRYALKIAEKSDMKCKHGCVIIDRKGSIISAQHNKMIHVPNIKELNKNFQKGKKMSIHAEENALRNVDQTKLNGATMYVVRKGCEENNLLCMNSKPCKRCTIIIKVFMKKHGLKNVMYSSD
jgi:tRNA(Arg) A34 adenosine deaminase TadA